MKNLIFILFLFIPSLAFSQQEIKSSWDAVSDVNSNIIRISPNKKQIAFRGSNQVISKYITIYNLETQEHSCCNKSVVNDDMNSFCFVNDTLLIWKDNFKYFLYNIETNQNTMISDSIISYLDVPTIDSKNTRIIYLKNRKQFEIYNFQTNTNFVSKVFDLNPPEGFTAEEYLSDVTFIPNTNLIACITNYGKYFIYDLTKDEIEEKQTNIPYRTIGSEFRILDNFKDNFAFITIEFNTYGILNMISGEFLMELPFKSLSLTYDSDSDMLYALEFSDFGFDYTVIRRYNCKDFTFDTMQVNTSFNNIMRVPNSLPVIDSLRFLLPNNLPYGTVVCNFEEKTIEKELLNLGSEIAFIDSSIYTVKYEFGVKKITHNESKTEYSSVFYNNEIEVLSFNLSDQTYFGLVNNLKNDAYNEYKVYNKKTESFFPSFKFEKKLNYKFGNTSEDLKTAVFYNDTSIVLVNTYDGVRILEVPKLDGEIYSVKMASNARALLIRYLGLSDIEYIKYIHFDRPEMGFNVSYDSEFPFYNNGYDFAESDSVLYVRNFSGKNTVIYFMTLSSTPKVVYYILDKYYQKLFRKDDKYYLCYVNSDKVYIDDIQNNTVKCTLELPRNDMSNIRMVKDSNMDHIVISDDFTANVYDLKDLFTGIKESPEKYNIKELRLINNSQLDLEPLINKNTQLKIYNSNGQTLYIANYNQTLDVSAFMNGVYFVESNNQYYKFIKK